MTSTFEFPGFHMPDTPVFNGALGTSMFNGPTLDPTAVLDLGMVFGCRLWGHDIPALDPAELGAPGVGDLFTHDARERANAALCAQVAEEFALDSQHDLRALVLHTGSEAVETALKTALRATGRDRIVAFEGAYHGTFGLALTVTHGSQFRDPWAAQYASNVSWTPWGEVPTLDAQVACVIVEPWQGRAGVIAPPEGFLAALRAECDRVGAILIVDAVMCGSGRTGADLIEQGAAAAQPDIVCLGKALGSGYTASAVVARASIAEAAWEHGAVEPAHTSTTLGDPASCAGILRTLVRLEHRSEELDDAAVAWRETLTKLAADTGLELRGTGLLWALDTGAIGGGVELARRLLDEQRILTVPSGPDGNAITIYPAVVCTDLERDRFTVAVTAALA